MTPNLRLLLFVCISLLFMPALQARFTPGNLAVFRAEAASANNTAFSKAGVKNVAVYNSAGILYQQLSFSQNAQDVSTNGWAKGYYLLRISMADGSVTTEGIVIQ
jgi:hypothetical protein